MTFSAIGIARHRIARDGDGVTTLVGGFGCPLACRYCLNPHCVRPSARREYTADALMERLLPDNLYFAATAGGVIFGGGEPLLQAAFIRAFIEKVKAAGYDWRFGLETSLAVPGADLMTDRIDYYIADCKDMNPDVYRAYTGRDPAPMQENLAILAGRCPEKVRVRVPLIPGFNDKAGCDASEAALRKMGFSDIERFVYRTEIGK